MADELNNGVAAPDSFINLGVEGEVAKQKRFKPLKSLNGLCIGTLESVVLTETEVGTVKKDGTPSTWEYAGTKLPYLVFNFKSYRVPGNQETDVDRIFTFSEKVIGSIKNDGSPMEDKSLKGLYESMWFRIKHLLDIYTKESRVDISANENLKKALAIISTETVIKGNNKQVRIDAFKNLFQVVATIFNTGKDGSPIYMRAANVPMVTFIKLLPDYYSHKFFTFPTFVGDGFIEIARTNSKGELVSSPSIEIKAGETIELRDGKGKLATGTGGADADNGVISPEITDPLVRASIGLPPLK